MEEVAAVGDEDVISLGGADDGDEVSKPAEARSSSPRKSMSGKVAGTGPSKAPPTGPRRTNTAPSGLNGVPRGHRASSTDVQKAETSAEAPAHGNHQALELPPAPAKGEIPLPEGWVKFDSATHNRPFYYHKETKTTVWQRPVASAEQLRPKSPAAPPTPEESPAPEGEASAMVKVGSPRQEPKQEAAASIEDTAVVGPSGPDQAAPGYAGRRSRLDDVPSGPASWVGGGDSYRPRQDRSSSPSGQPAKRFKRDEGGRSPPLSARLVTMDRTRSPPRGMLPPRQRSPPSSGPPQGPRSFANERSRSPPRRRSFQTLRGPEPARRTFDRPDSRTAIRAPLRAPEDSPSRLAQGANTAPLTQSRWGPRSGATTPVVERLPSPIPNLASRIRPATDRSIEADPAATRARIQEERAAAEEVIKRLREEEERLALEEEQKKREAEERRKVEDGLLRKKEELQKEMADRDAAMKRDKESRPESSMYPPRTARDRPMPLDMPPRDSPRQSGFSSIPSGDNYRPGPPPTSERPPLSSRFGDGPPRTRDEPPFGGRRSSPPRRLRLHSPQRDIRQTHPSVRSPSSRNGEFYYPIVPDRAPPRDLAARIGNDRPPPRSLSDRIGRDNLPPREMMDRGPPLRDMMDRGPPPRDMIDRRPRPRDAMSRGPPPRDVMDRGPPPRNLQERIRPREFAEPMSAFARSRPRSPPSSMPRQSSGWSDRLPEHQLAQRMSMEQGRPPRDMQRDDRPRHT